jgi:RNA polymerase sigma-70 factor, ECF subfamily
MAMTISIDDRQLVESYQAGDTEAFAELVRGHGASLLGHAMRKLGDRAAAEDAVQETFVRAYRALPRFDGDYRLGPWLHRILANVCADEGNRRRREAEKFDRFAADPFAADLAPGVEDELGLDLDVDDSALADALASLPPSYREALNLRFVQELPYDEVARLAGVSEQNARARVSRARSAARSALRGVAAIPAFLVPALRRTEAVAAAATHGDGVRLATEAAVASAPAATPVVTKAVIGICVVAAMAAPSSAPVAPDHGRALVAAEATVEVEPTSAGAPSVSDAPTVPVAPTTGSGTAAGTADTDGGELSPSESGTAPVGGKVDPAPLPGGSTAAPVAGDGDEAPSAPEPVALAGGSVVVSGLTITPAGPRLDLVGTTTLTVGEATFEGAMTGRVSYTDHADVRRFTADLRLVLINGSVVNIRLNVQGTPVAEQVELPLDEVTTFELSGSFRATSDAAVHLVDGGLANGTFDLAGPGLTLRLT